jgi:TolB-like protein
MKSGADYFLKGNIKELSKSYKGKESNYMYFSFELIDTESTNVVWANDYEVKKVGARGVLYR